MHFLSLEWLAWLLAVVAVYWLLPRVWRDAFLVAATFAFLAIYAPLSVALLTGLTVGVYYLVRPRPLPAWRACLGGALIVGVLIAFKLGASATEEPGGFVRDVVVPMGLAYYAIRFLLYVIDSYKGVLPAHDLRAFAAYQFFLPTIVVGPIHRFPAFLDDFHYKRWDADQLSAGLQRILYGYAKIVILGNYLVSGVFAQAIGDLPASQEALALYLEIVRQGLNLYFQFSGFTDIAIGFALLLGYRVMENFNWPYLKANISEFWRAWHISLTSFAREHVFGVVFANTRSRVLGVILTLVFVGLWHEISLRYLAWGVYHGTGIAVWQWWRGRVQAAGWRVANPGLRRVLHAASVLLTVHFVWFSFVLVRQPDLGSAAEIYGRILVYWWL